jgi:uncharacterized membrane protein
MVYGALIALGLLGIVANVVFHWMLELHRAVPRPHALTVEVVLVFISTGLLVLGTWQEVRARRCRRVLERGSNY